MMLSLAEIGAGVVAVERLFDDIVKVLSRTWRLKPYTINYKPKASMLAWNCLQITIKTTCVVNWALAGFQSTTS